VLDEVQRRPELFSVLRVLADRKPVRTRFLVLGSATPDLRRQSSDSPGGRIAYYQLPVPNWICSSCVED
jgi:predicted AAA+ superfamily ATPase